MQRIPCPLLTLGVALGAVACAAQAQSSPPLKPGLWQVQSEREVDGQKAPDPMEMLKSLPPESRKQMEAMMKQRGFGVGSDGVQKICHSRESLDQGKWGGDSESCKTDITSRSPTVWKWRSSCTQPAYEGSGEAHFAGPENYTVKNLMTTQHEGKARTTRMTLTARWLGPDCGDLKPIQPRPATK